MHAIRLEIVHISGKFAATICISVSANSFTERTTERTGPLVVTLTWTKSSNLRLMTKFRNPILNLEQIYFPMTLVICQP